MSRPRLDLLLLTNHPIITNVLRVFCLWWIDVDLITVLFQWAVLAGGVGVAVCGGMSPHPHLVEEKWQALLDMVFLVEYSLQILAVLPPPLLLLVQLLYKLNDKIFWKNVCVSMICFKRIFHLTNIYNYTRTHDTPGKHLQMYRVLLYSLGLLDTTNT